VYASKTDKPKRVLNYINVAIVQINYRIDKKLIK